MQFAAPSYLMQYLNRQIVKIKILAHELIVIHVSPICFNMKRLSRTDRSILLTYFECSSLSLRGSFMISTKIACAG